MKRLLLILAVFISALGIKAQQLPDDVQKVFDQAEKFTKKGDYDQAVASYKEVLRSVEHIPSLINAGDIEMKLRPQPNYRAAYDYYTRAIAAIDQGIAGTEKKSVKKYLTNLRTEVIPNQNKAKSYVDDFDKAKELKEGGNRLLEDPDLKD